MARPPKPWYWEARKRWVVNVGGQRHELAVGPKRTTKAEAEAAFHRLMAGEQAKVRGSREDLKFARVADLFLGHAAKTVKPATYEQYRIKLQSACDAFGGVKAGDLKPSHVAAWTEGKGWSDSTRRGAITYLKLALNYAVDEGLLGSNPLAKLKRPRMAACEKTLSPEERVAVAGGYDDGDAFRDFLVALTETGARPSEVAHLEARMIDWATGTASFAGKTTGATGKQRVVYLTTTMVALCQRLAILHPTGPLLRNRDGQLWTTNAIRCRFRRLRGRLGLDPKISAKVFRHSFITDGLERGLSVATIAELAGHSDWKMVQQHYSKLKDRREHLRREAEKAAGSGPAAGQGNSPEAEGDIKPSEL